MTTNTITAADVTTAITAAEAARTRLDFAKSAPKVFRAIIGFDAAARAGLDPALVELIQIRSSLLNHCAYCLHMHTNDARKAGESEDRLHMVAVWREARHFFTPKERAALALTEALTWSPTRASPTPSTPRPPPTSTRRNWPTSSP
ncbi:hypothetical protein M878_34370 [Streptomyces roseochromogenus subsp. oscitans DS 12.976]|uniref:Carboxymuconolactone decarboxylase-like domain-containing protein n=1 Tax=Streptomyces roseochromogenus subsp. oscitans DS 12.976 TaxID=1352936 RepID=V6JUD9_STRRC|nr:hypothetical protein M878_34370 [Streptomyces roseochromogenus subsp. oscitans DS 12.976]